MTTPTPTTGHDPIDNAIKLAALEGRLAQIQRELDLITASATAEITTLRLAVDDLRKTTTRQTVTLAILITAAHGATMALQAHLLHL